MVVSPDHKGGGELTGDGGGDILIHASSSPLPWLLPHAGGSTRGGSSNARGRELGLPIAACLWSIGIW
jgi:hypothetical protein